MEKIQNKIAINLLWSLQWIYKGIFPLNRGVCRYQPTCSQYAYKALKSMSFLRAILYITWRIIRCNPISRGGYDPVPTVSSKEG